MKIRKLLIFPTALVILLTSSTSVFAASYSKSELSKVRYYQKLYQGLSKKAYNESNLYKSKPRLFAKFKVGSLSNAYITTSLGYLNYYRRIVGLPPEKTYSRINADAQAGASVLASLNADVSLSAHGLSAYKKPGYISNSIWRRASAVTFGNINFIEDDKAYSPEQNMTDLLKETANLAGKGNVGHRALILSSKATKMGFGAAYGTNGTLYYVQNGVFANDIVRKPVKKIVTYPAGPVFPIEMLSDNTPWSVGFATRRLSKKPTVYISDLTDKVKKKALSVKVFDSYYFGYGYLSIVTFYNPIKLINTHKYQVTISKVYNYKFRLFQQNGTD
ncbi:MAG: CAP domain-containing protein [Lactobacillus sp.]|nr:CAP domain-containing protein [Lactobacillus sp.]